MDPPDAEVELVGRISAVPSILRVIREMTGLRLAFVARVTKDDWKACAVQDEMSFGLVPGGHLQVSTTLCADVRDTANAIVIDHASADPIYSQHPTPKMYGLESYISVPIFLPSGDYFGNVCALDSVPARLRDSQALATMTLFAELIGTQVAAEMTLAATTEQLLDARRTAELREQFIAVLGHDLRTPLSTVMMATELMLANDQAPPRELLERVRRSTKRMTSLVSDILDFARARLGEGMPHSPVRIESVAESFKTIVEELRVAHPKQEIRFVAADCSLEADPARLAQVVSNLISNAVHHGEPGAPIDVDVALSPESVTLSVTNRGQPIPDALLPKLFQPYQRLDRGGAPGGLGLGLYIVSEVVRLHRGRIDAQNLDGGLVRFVCTFPTL